MRHDLERYWAEFSAGMARMPFGRLAEVAEALLACQRRDGTLFTLGNGGSAATASHIACDLAKGTRAGGPPTFRVMPLTDNVPLLTAWANDADYACVFAEQLAALARPGDVVLLISASGNSPNVLASARAARAAGALAWTGAGGGQIAELADIVVRAPLEQVEQIEDAHALFGHSLCVALRERLRGNLRPLPARHHAAHDVLAEQLAAAAGELGE
jgi:D-sedoheptulose 7-phosphate isomerase